MHFKTLSRFDFENFIAMMNHYHDCERDHTFFIHTTHYFDRNGQAISNCDAFGFDNPEIRYILFFYDSL